MADQLQVRSTPEKQLFPTKRSGSNPTIAYFGSSPGGVVAYEKWQMWRGIAEACREHEFNLIYIAGEQFEISPQAVLYDLVDSHNADGIILWNSFFSLHSTLERTQAFVDRYAPIPAVSIEVALENCANLMIDNAQGIRDLISHLVEVHGYQRIAFISKEQHYVSRSRQNSFQQIMTEYGLFNPDLIGSLDVLDSRGLRPGIDYQAIIAYSDIVAIQVVEELTARGVRIPNDVAVTGFNDGMEARGALPPLTTIRLPFRNLGRQAVEIISRSLQGEPPEGQIHVPLQLILRRSCGCLEPLAEQAAAGIAQLSRLTLDEMLAQNRADILSEMALGMGTSIESLANSWAVSFLDLFVAALQDLLSGRTQSPSNDYIRKLNILLQDALIESGNVNRWHESISIMRRYLRPCLSGRELDLAEDLWQQARVLIGQAAVRVETHRSWKTSQRADILRKFEADLLTSLDFHEILKVLADGLPRLGVQDFYLVLYEDQYKLDGWARLLFAIQDGQSIPVESQNQPFHPRDLLPDGWISNDQPYCLVIEALHLREEQIGYIVYKMDPPVDSSTCEIFQALRIQLSGALKEVRLRQNLQDALQQAEEANMLKSRFLSMVSHELRTPINLIVGLSEMAMRQQTGERKSSLEALKKFNEQIYASGQHLDRLIRDVLDLASSQAGQMRLVCASLDMAPMLHDVASIGKQLAEQKSLDFRAEIPEKLPRVWADKTRLRQIILNLISNAVKFTAHGEVVLKVTIDTKDLLLSVEDTGLGIDQGEQERIFDEFHQSDRTVVRGYGGIGLGLAITRRLVEMHGGRIWVASNGAEGSGSRFSFTLPMMAADGSGEEQPVSSRDGIVLVITKSAGGAQRLTQRLNHHGFKVEELALDDHPDFMQDLTASPPGAVILDLAPASEQGWEIMRRLKEMPCTEDVPVLFYSLMVEEDAGSMFEMDYLQKPVGADQLVQALKRYGLKGANQKDATAILIIDDEPGILDLHVRMVKSQLPDCQVLSAKTGKEGLSLMRQYLPDLVLLDLMMPEMDGFGVLKAMQEEQLLQGIPVIILSAQVLTKRDMARLNQGVAAVLGKGLFSTKETIVRIENALARNKRLGSEAQRMVRHAMAFIHEHYREPISRTDIAVHLSVNEQYLSRTFNKELGIGPMAYLSRYRIQQAKRLLEAGSMSITEVALEVGLSSQSYFSRIFQHETGVTPSAYQRGERPKN